jgi:hypothetical protein
MRKWSFNCDTPLDVAVDQTGNLLVPDRSEEARVRVFRQNGDAVTEFGAGQLDEPVSICIDNDGRILVGDRQGVYVFAFSE